ncbi:unnamed protein product [Arabidopsis lyrata]|uniref:Predicted protein n=1 Tax=Arabidopsis lyrata subsp. lyrata TaxID=81972 RepID=D7LYW3_ARALL|nr:predicted protein [Arabidopsis lyrata subsp. lyrata]CAH8272912.1 unnamed protein product [Arabidopsis lyrata]
MATKEAIGSEVCQFERIIIRNQNTKTATTFESDLNQIRNNKKKNTKRKLRR